MNNTQPILIDSWYGSIFKDNTINLDSQLHKTFKPYIVRLANKIFFIKGILIFLIAKKFGTITFTALKKEYSIFLVLNFLSIRKYHIVILEFIHPESPSLFKSTIIKFYSKYFIGPIINKTVTKIHVLTEREKYIYSNFYNISIDKFIDIRWPLHFKNIQLSLDEINDQNLFDFLSKNDKYIMISGRDNVDWNTFFTVANSNNWPFIAVCSNKHLQYVNALNKSTCGIVLSEISQALHNSLVKSAHIYTICLLKSKTSVGQVRIMVATELETPIIISKVDSISEYIEDNINAITIPINNSKALEDAINFLINNNKEREALIQRAKQFRNNWTMEKYLTEVKKLIIS